MSKNTKRCDSIFEIESCKKSNFKITQNIEKFRRNIHVVENLSQSSCFLSASGFHVYISGHIRSSMNNSTILFISFHTSYNIFQQIMSSKDRFEFPLQTKR